MESPNLENKPELTCIVFPGVVKNEEKAIKCLGGIRDISEAYSDPSKRLGLNFQPENPFLKKIYSEARKTAGILIKVRVKKTKTAGEVKKEVVSTTVLGRVTKIYKYESMCDFQFLPLVKDESGAYQCFADKIFPSGLDDIDYVKKPSPTYIVPSYFTRAEKPFDYAYTNKKCPDIDHEADNIQEVRLSRKSRKLPIMRCYFNLTEPMPTEPNISSINRKNEKLAIYPQLKQDIEFVKKMLEERPILTQNYVKFQTKYKSVKLRIILPCLAVYMNDGPWQKTWVKYGYDPRKLPEARKYQTLDVRVRSDGGMNAMVASRYRYNQLKKNAREVRSEKNVDDQNSPDDVDEETVYFRPGTVPTQRQIYYQYCDIELPEVQAMLAAEPELGACHRARGWLPADAADRSRDCIFRYMRDAMFSTGNPDVRFEQGSSEDESGSNSDDGDDGEAEGMSATAKGDETL